LQLKEREEERERERKKERKKERGIGVKISLIQYIITSSRNYRKIIYS